MRSAVLADTARPVPMSGARLCLDGLSASLGPVRLLSHIRLDIALGARTVILGPNGAGKSSLLQVLHGLIAPDTGSLQALDASGRRFTPRLALVFQRPVMLRRSVLGNIEHALAIAGLPSALRKTRALAALEAVDLVHLAQRPARGLSGGEQQRLSVARAQALQPDCLLLDEPTASLDPAAGAAIERHLMDLSSRGCGLIMSTHDLSLARRMAQHCVVMHQGRVIEAGEATQVLNAPRSETTRRFLAGEWLA